MEDLLVSVRWIVLDAAYQVHVKWKTQVALLISLLAGATGAYSIHDSRI